MDDNRLGCSRNCRMERLGAEERGEEDQLGNGSEGIHAKKTESVKTFPKLVNRVLEKRSDLHATRSGKLA